MVTTVRQATSTDAALLHALAMATFPLACPPSTPQADIDDFLARHLSTGSFSAYLADVARILLLAESDGHAAGYTMLIVGEPTDPEVARAITTRPTAELSKCYVRPEHHGGGVAVTLMVATLAAAQERGVAGVWLGVNQENVRAARFYEKCGFVVVGTKHFRLGERVEDDFVREHVFQGAA
ncbi:MAG: GNAT family N-acetyltransferase [Chloroflexi bacterium]|nr:GNAT family N-acetyltransferase [Chloroflexota bacterium]